MNIVTTVATIWGLLNQRRVYMADETDAAAGGSRKPSAVQLLGMLLDEGMQYYIALVLAPIPLLVRSRVLPWSKTAMS